MITVHVHNKFIGGHRYSALALCGLKLIWDDHDSWHIDNRFDFTTPPAPNAAWCPKCVARYNLGYLGFMDL